MANLAQTRGEDDNLIDFAHLLQEVVYAGAFDHIDIMPMILNLNWDDVIRLLY